MNNDLISREALKTALANNNLIRDFNLQFDGIIGEIIDNAPTVTPQALYNGIIELISKNGITTIDELLETLKGGAE